MGEPFTTPIRVRYGECDMQGVVFNAHYLSYVDVAITELWRAALGSYDVMLDRGVDVVVAESRLRFHGSAKFDDELTVAVLVTHLGTTSIVTEHSILRGEELLVRCEIRHVVVDRESLAKTPIPDWLRTQLAASSAHEPAAEPS
ncbi:MAG TPA: thioesterase family protein [Solirubrobacteraceae bacterium]